MASKRTTVRDLRRHNRSLLLSKLYFDGPLSRHELSQLTGLSAATVSNVTAELGEERLITEAGQVESDGGRPRVLLRVDPAYGHVAGVDIGETGVKVELFDLAMNRLATVDHPLPKAPDPATAVEQVTSGLREVFAGFEDASVLGVGIGVPGTVEQGERVLVHAPTVGWDAVPLVSLLQEAGVSLPLFVDNGAKTQGQAEMWFGAGRGARHAVIALIGSGVGAAVVTDGTTYRGSTSSAGEWGHTTIAYGGQQCRCGALGCLEAYIGAGGVLARYRKVRGKDVPGEDEQAQFAALLEAAPRSKTAAKVLDETAGYLGAGIANLINLFNPERIVIGGWAGSALGEQLLPRIRSVAGEHALRHPFSQTSIQLGSLGLDAVATGAATLPVADLLAQGATSKIAKPGAPNSDAA
ncbi:Sugar kinase of the NBD/HSP70 family, may contain an N-terminal HTH domain [Amycolatopsis pretoriensis]|uniref:Sugar kinase of the NBD/HSP70 family, may contain an N-terminal HTH domain n=1 Tax=Amycolatopsis pretoriensis TaxID=218821 RepID=A0A1H5RH62_9PSEU|nr:ROK family transcriptional regulator [Amycolatopsis pretoriensis]SEF36811.1 Sugar kinase of the NBD/HSP70 family, may contain an N-terminal HTH domain [Amycolatopsis pretoriensis]